MDRFSTACDNFGLTISIKNIMHQGSNTTPSITLNDKRLDVVDCFTYLGSTVTNKLSLDT